MVYGAEQALASMRRDSAVWNAVQAYTNGINAYIDQLRPEEYPLEYKLMQFDPEPWTPLKTALMLKNLTYTLAGGSNDIANSNTRKWFGSTFMNELLGARPEPAEPVVPTQKYWSKYPSPELTQPDSLFRSPMVEGLKEFKPDPQNGSNNWVLDSTRTASGFPLLANDPHLNTTLPSIWYEVQLHGPDHNSYGVSVPGAPMIIIGFNEQSGWGFTNVGADVMDWYAVTTKDSIDGDKYYRYDGTWKKTRRRIETIQVKGSAPVEDTVYYTHHGPIVRHGSAEPIKGRNIPKDHALRWIAHQKSNELHFFYELNRNEGFDDVKQAMPSYTAPSQNMAYADTAGTIALWSIGRLPLKWEGQGRYIGDGSDPAYEWQGWIPWHRNPHQVNPARGFVSSANQKLTADGYPYYLADSYGDYERGKRINDELRDIEHAKAEQMLDLQLDTKSLHAESALPLLLDSLETEALTQTQAAALDTLRNWNYRVDKNRLAPTIFSAWWDTLYSSLWEDDYPHDSLDVPMRKPSRAQTVALLKNQPGLKWFNNSPSGNQTSLRAHINDSFKETIVRLTDEHGEEMRSWKWGETHPARLPHLAGLEGFGREFATGGNSHTVNAINGDHGPSWRMIVDLEPPVTGYGIYPGGPSGNPGSKWYDNYARYWAQGRMIKLPFYRERPRFDEQQYFILIN